MSPYHSECFVEEEYMTEKKEYLNELYHASLITSGVVVLSMASKKLLGEKLTDASSIKDIAKLSLGVSLSSVMVKYAQDKKWVPVDPFKSSLVLKGRT